MKTKKWKRALSAVLAGTMLVTSLSAALTAWAAEEDTAVTDVEAKITSWYNTHRSKLYGSDEEAKAAARAAYNDVSAAVKNLSDEQKKAMDIRSYAYWMYTVIVDEAREANEDPTAYPATGDYIDVTVNHFSDVTDVMGTLPESYQKLMDQFKTTTTTVAYTDAAGNEYYIDQGEDVEYKDNEVAQKLLDDMINALAASDYESIQFASYFYPYTNSKDKEGEPRTGFYIYCSSPTSAKVNYIFGIIAEYKLAEQNDLIGTDAVEFNRSNYINRSGSIFSGYTYAWKDGVTAQDYIDGFNAWVDAYPDAVMAPHLATFEAIYPVFDAIPEYAGLSDILQKVITAADGYYSGASDVESVRAAVDAYAALSETAKACYDYLGGYVTLYVGYVVERNCLDEYTAETLTPQVAYDSAPAVEGKKLNYAMGDLQDALTELEMEDFINDVRAADPAALTDAEIEEFRSRYMALGDFQDQLPADVAAKFMEMIKPVAGDDQFEDDLLAFTPAAVDKTEISGDTIQLVGGVQNVSENLWSTAVSLLNALKVFGVDLGVDLSNGLEPIVADALYNEMLPEMILDLYATLSQMNDDIGLPLGLTIGSIVNMIIKPAGLADSLVEEKFAGAAEKIRGAADLVALGEIDFTPEDFGFTAGDRDGMIDALLAVLRPITAMLEPDAMIIIITLGVQMCDYINAEGEYTTGVYGNLIPLFEQLGMNVPSAEEYAANYNAVLESKGETVASDEYLRPIIESLFEDVVDPILADPVNALVDFLPRLAYIIDGDRLNSYLKPAIAQMGGTLAGALGGLDLGTAAINGMIPDSFTIPVNDTTNITLNIGDINWARLADCATLSVVPSVSNANAYTLLRTGEPETVFTEIFYLLYTALFGDPDVDMTQYNNTMAALKAVINNDALWMFVDAIGENTIVKGKEYAYGQILDLFSTIDFTDCKVAANVIVNGAGEVLQAGQQMNGSFTAVKGVNLAYIVRATAEDTVIDTLTVNGVAVPEAAGKAYYLLNAAAAKGQVIEVTFRSSTQYTVTAQAGINGNVTPANQTVFSCQTASVTATADPNCLIESFTVNGVEVPEAVDKVSYTWTGVVTADTQIVVKFAVKEPATPILTDVTITRDGTPIDGNVTYVTVPWYKLWTTGNVTLGYTVNEGVEVASVKWDYANWSVEDPQATIGSTDTDTTVIRAKNGIGPRSCWIQVTVTDTNGVSVTSDPVKVRFINFDWQK